MRCHKAKLNLDGQDSVDPEILEHLKSCPSCARYAEAAGTLSKSLDTVKSQPAMQPTPLSVIRAELATRTGRKDWSFMAKLSKAWGAHPRLGLGMALAIFILLFCVLVPLPYTRTVGYDVRFGGLDASQTLDTEKLVEGLKAVGVEHISLSANVDGAESEYTMSGLQSLSDARRAAAVFTSMTGTAVRPAITPVIETVSGSLYAQARDKLIRIEINGEGKTDDQIKAEIESKLAEQGFSGSVVFFKTGEDGKRQINLEIKADDSAGGQPHQGKRTIEIDTRGKTDAQIEADVKTRLAEDGSPNANVNISSEKTDSTRRMEVKIERK